MGVSLVNFDKALMLEVVRTSFTDLVDDVYKNLGFNMTAIESYKYEWEIVDELRNKIKIPEIRESAVNVQYATSSLISNTITDKASMMELVKSSSPASVATYDSLVNYLEDLAPEEYQPPIEVGKFSLRDSNELIYSIPNYPKLDPRRTGRIVRIGPKSIINGTLLKYLLVNAGRFGFVFYGPTDPSVWYWRGDKLPIVDVDGKVRNYFTPYETSNTFSPELNKLTPATTIIQQQQPVQQSPRPQPSPTIAPQPLLVGQQQTNTSPVPIIGGIGGGSVSSGG